MKILSFGEIIWDVYERERYIGGAPLNFSAHAARLGNEVLMLSAVGDDELGGEALKQLEYFGVSTRYVTVSDKPTGVCLVTLDENSTPTYEVVRDVAYDRIPTKGVAGEFDLLYFGTLALREEYNLSSIKELIARGNFKNIFVDVNLRAPFFSGEVLDFAFKRASIVKISREELPVTAELIGEKYAGYEDFAESLGQRYKNLSLIIITLDKDGAFAYDLFGGEKFTEISRPAKVLSTVGAGDSFCAAFIHEYLRGKSISDCLAIGNRLAAFVVSQRGAVPDYSIDTIF